MFKTYHPVPRSHQGSNHLSPRFLMTYSPGRRNLWGLTIRITSAHQTYHLGWQSHQAHQTGPSRSKANLTAFQRLVALLKVLVRSLSDISGTNPYLYIHGLAPLLSPRRPWHYRLEGPHPQCSNRPICRATTRFHEDSLNQAKTWRARLWRPSVQHGGSYRRQQHILKLFI
jgi:hypothetical protein